MMVRKTQTLAMAVMACLAAPTTAVAAVSKNTIAQKISREFGLTCHQIGGTGAMFCGGKSAETSVPQPQPHKVTPLPSQPVPDVKGFHKAFRIEPVLVQHGSGTATPTVWHGTAPAGQVIEKILPAGWQVYTKNGTHLLLSTPVLDVDPQKKSWVRVLKLVLKQSQLHGAIWWDKRTVMLWPAPILPSYIVSVAPDPIPHHAKTIPHSFHKPSTPKQAPSESVQEEKSHRHERSNYGLPANFHVGNTPVVPQLMVPASSPPMVASSLTDATPVFLLNRGDLILTDLQKWARQSGWTVVWQVPEDWQVPNTTTFSGDFQKAVSQVIQALSANGANVHAVFHTANNTVVISGAGGGE